MLQTAHVESRLLTQAVDPFCLQCNHCTVFSAASVENRKRYTTMAPTWRYTACIALVALLAGPAGRGAEAATRKSEEERRAEYERYVSAVRKGRGE